MTDLPADPAEPVIASREDLAQALTAQFLGNADAGDNAANDEIVTAMDRRRRQP